MRILHTSDWHLGRTFGGVPLLDDQRAFVAWLVGQCVAEEIELVVVAGDVYDRAYPPNDAVVLFLEALQALLATGAKVAVITGNHDGADRVAAYDDLTSLAGLYVRGGYRRVGEVVTLQFADGPLDLVLLPFLEPQAAPDQFVDTTTAEPAADPADDAGDGVQRRVRRTHQSVLAAAAQAAAAQVVSPRSLAVAHAFVTGGEQSESERQLTVGGTGDVSVDMFAPFSYTALGHLHRPQQVTATVQYSGTPLAYSFSEEHGKSVHVVELAPDGACAVRRVPVPVGRAVRTVTGTMADLLAATPDDPQAFVRAIVTDRETVLDAKTRLSVVYPFILEVKLQPEGVGGGLVEVTPEVLEMSTLAATVAFWEAAEGAPPDEPTADLLTELVAAATEGGAA